MIKVTRKGSEVKVTYSNEVDRDMASKANLNSIPAATEIATTIRLAIALGYGFAKCRSILEGDSLDISNSASAMGKKGGSAKTEAKSSASRTNGKLGGRPKKEKAE